MPPLEVTVAKHVKKVLRPTAVREVFLQEQEARSLIPCGSTGKASDDNRLCQDDLKFLSKLQEGIKKNISSPYEVRLLMNAQKKYCSSFLVH